MRNAIFIFTLMNPVGSIFGRRHRFRILCYRYPPVVLAKDPHHGPPTGEGHGDSQGGLPDEWSI